jgi:glycosyltransferase involved in cell wall biosynthesis
MAQGLSADFRFHVLAAADAGAHQGDDPTFGLDNELTFIHCVDLKAKDLRRVLAANHHRLLMLSSFFDPKMTIPALGLMHLGLTPSRPVIVSPRGEFSPSALALSARKKQAFLKLSRMIGLHRNVWFHATTKEEAQLIEQQNLPCRGILVAHNASMAFDLPPYVPAQARAPLRVAFLSRISPMKNLDFLLRSLATCQMPVALSIYGPIEDAEHWSVCKDEISCLPPHVTATHRGTLANADVPAALAAHDLFYLPTRGENFGHVIHEALMSGTPALISDQTPWQGLESKRAGWVLPLDDSGAFARTIDAFAMLSPDEWQSWRKGARAFGEARLCSQASIDETRTMFEAVIADHAARGGEPRTTPGHCRDAGHAAEEG